MEKTPIGTIVKTGETCPETGTWEVEKGPGTQKSIKAGDKMPPSKFMAVEWKLVSYDE